jgi:hypothetical protein
LIADSQPPKRVKGLVRTLAFSTVRPFQRGFSKFNRPALIYEFRYEAERIFRRQAMCWHVTRWPGKKFASQLSRHQSFLKRGNSGIGLPCNHALLASADSSLFRGAKPARRVNAAR